MAEDDSLTELLEKNAPKTLDEFLGAFVAKKELTRFLEGAKPSEGKPAKPASPSKPRKQTKPSSSPSRYATRPE